MPKKTKKHKKSRKKRVDVKEKELFKGFEERLSKAGLWIMFAASAIIVVAAVIGLMWFFLAEANFGEVLRI